MNARRYRWVALSIFVLSSAINYLDRQTLATVAPLVRAEFHLSNAQYGLILTAFSIAYAGGAPFAGMLIDRIGMNRGISLAIGLWSCAGIFTGFTRGLAGLLGCRGVLGMAEAAGIPAAGKAIHRYLLPAERALGNALNQAGVSLGLMLAPPAATWIAVTYGWRQAFVVTGCLGLIWIPVWNWTARVTARAALPDGYEHQAVPGVSELLRSPRLWALMVANALNMSVYSLWTNWTTLYLVEARRLTLAEAAWYAWIPPLIAMLGGFGGGSGLIIACRRSAGGDSRRPVPDRNPDQPQAACDHEGLPPSVGYGDPGGHRRCEYEPQTYACLVERIAQGALRRQQVLVNGLARRRDAGRFRHAQDASAPEQASQPARKSGEDTGA